MGYQQCRGMLRYNIPSLLFQRRELNTGNFENMARSLSSLYGISQSLEQGNIHKPALKQQRSLCQPGSLCSRTTRDTAQGMNRPTPWETLQNMLLWMAPLPMLLKAFSLPLFCLIYCKVCTVKQADNTKIMAIKTTHMTNSHEIWGQHLNVPQTLLLPNLLLPYC